MIDPIQTAPTLPSTAPTDTTVNSKTATGPAGVDKGVGSEKEENTEIMICIGLEIICLPNDE
jgi:hypothetical protein